MDPVDGHAHGHGAAHQHDEHLGGQALESDGKHASRVAVELGRSSVDTIEIVDGLVVGDQVILSDTSRWDNNERIKLR